MESEFEKSCKGKPRSNDEVIRAYLYFLNQRRRTISAWQKRDDYVYNCCDAVQCIDGHDMKIIAILKKRGYAELVLDLLDLREQQRMPRFPQGWEED